MRLASYLLAFAAGLLLLQEPAAYAAPSQVAQSEADSVRADGVRADRSSRPARIEVYRVLFDNFPIPDSYQHPVAPPLGRRNLEFRFGITGVPAADSVDVDFRMEGLDAEWIDAGERRVVYYRDLHPGTYTFEVRARAAAGRWTSTDTVPVYIEPFFFETWWFIALAIFGLIAATSGVFWYQTRHTRRQALQLARVVEERTEALRTERDRAEQALAEAQRERVTSEEALAMVEDQAVQLLRMDQLKSRLFANLSHEFRTPLTLIIDPLERAVRGELGELDGYTVHALDLARLNANRLLRLINQLLDLSKLEAGGMELRARELDLSLVLREATDLFATEAERLGVTLLFRTDVTHLPVFADREKLEKIVFNLISNALKATPHGGKVLVTLQTAETEPGGDGSSGDDASDGDGASERNGAPERRGYAEVVVRDTGMGIPKGDLDHIFDRFYQSESGLRHGGTGIGLSLVKELTELHRGEVAVDSEPGFGSTFTVRLPLGRRHLSPHELGAAGAAVKTGADAEQSEGGEEADWDPLPDALAAPEPAPSVPQTPSNGDERPLVLIVDDVSELRRLLRTYLAPRYRLIEASNGKEALQLARKHHPDVIVSDILMPVMDGLNLCQQVRADEDLADTPVVLLTAVASDESRLAGLDTGADHYLTKPFLPEELRASVRNLLRRRQTLRERFSDEVVLQPLGLPVQSADAAFMQQVFATIEQHLDDGDFTVALLADEVGLSQSQLKRKLRSIVDQSPVELIRTYRLERAAQLLRGHAGSVSEVAYDVGFSSASYFTKVFREHFGRLPSEVLDDAETTDEGPTEDDSADDSEDDSASDRS